MATSKAGDKFISDLFKKRNERIEPIVKEGLSMLYDADLPAFDHAYIEARLREVLEDVLSRVDHRNEKIRQAQLAFLHEMLGQIQTGVPPQTKFKGDDLTSKRNKRCEPIVHDIIKQILNPDLIFSESEYITKCSEEYSSQFIRLLTFGFVDAYFNMVELSLAHSFKQANEILWDGKPKEEVTFKALDKVLKSRNKDIPGLEGKSV